MAAKKPRFTVTTPGSKTYYEQNPKPRVFETDDLAEALVEVLGYVYEGTKVTLKARKAKA